MTDTQANQPSTTPPPTSPRDHFASYLIALALLTALLLILVAWAGLPWGSPIDGPGDLWDFGDTEGAPLSETERAARTEASIQATIALAQLLTVFALLAAAGAALLSYRHSQQQARDAQASALSQFVLAQQAQAESQRQFEESQALTAKGQVTERFTRAIEQLGAVTPDGEKAWEIRLGGIYALEQIASDYPDHYYGPVMEVLTAYVRGHAQPGKEGESGAAAKLAQPPTELQAILTVIGRRSESLRTRRGVKIDLSKTWLNGAKLTFAHLERVDLSDAHLERANFALAHLEGAFLSSAHLEGANLTFAHLEGARLKGAHLNGAFLLHAQLQRTELDETQLESAWLDGANLEGATGLTQLQVDQTYMNEDTSPPTGLTRSTRSWQKDSA